MAPDAKTLVELKARLDDVAGVEHRLRGLATAEATVHQRDTYFEVPRGRLKLRQASDGKAQLVFYQRPDEPDVKVSQVHLLPVADGPGLEALLGEALGVRVVVEKERQILRWNGVQVHVDRVRGLGVFLEFELTVEDGPGAVVEGRRRLDAMLGQLGIPRAALQAGSYSDLLLAAGPNPG